MDEERRATTAVAFSIRDRASNELLAYAVVCPALRYASIRGSGNADFERRFSTASHWDAVERQLDDQLPSGTLDPLSAIPALLLHAPRRAMWVVQYLWTRTLLGDAQMIVEELDEWLRGEEPSPDEGAAPKAAS